MLSLPNNSSISNMLFVTILMIGCVAFAIPVGDTASSKHELSHLVTLLGKLKDAQRIRHSSLDSSSSKHRGTVPASSPAILLAGNDVGSDFDTDSEDDSASSVNKRQGAWSFDYGLGGGRFGKRGGYLEYGLGGGRFGRDVDHVDPSVDADFE